MTHPTPDQIDELKAYKALSPKERCEVLASISKLESMRINNNPPSSETILAVLAETGHLGIALACYGAQLTGKQWS